jgi:hypothetical protein
MGLLHRPPYCLYLVERNVPCHETLFLAYVHPMCCTVPAGVRVAHCDHWAQLRFREDPSTAQGKLQTSTKKRCELNRLVLSEFQVRDTEALAPPVVDIRQKTSRRLLNKEINKATAKSIIVFFVFNDTMSSKTMTCRRFFFDSSHKVFLHIFHGLDDNDRW